jgi:EAL domain-containing protein (putative c-di-GMP-specific phosphodiesterase class I)
VDVIVSSIIALAHSLAIRVNAEGVETETQRDALRGYGCDELQGYLLGRPQPRERLAHLDAVAASPAAAQRVPAAGGLQACTGLDATPACS